MSTASEPARVLLYSHDGFGLGHLRRNLNVAGRLVTELTESSCLVLAGLPGIPGLELPGGVDLVKLPSIRKVHTERWCPRTLRIEHERLQRMRRSVIDSTVDSFEPHLVLVDYMPAGVWGELVPALRRLRARGARIVLGLRDVLDAPTVTRKAWKGSGHERALTELYDRVLVYGERELFDTADAYGLESLVPGRVDHVGYLCAEDQPEDRGRERARLGLAADEQLLLVTAGGGADAFPMTRLALQALRRRLAEGWRARAVVVTGPLMPEAEVAAVRAEAEDLPADVRQTSDRLTSLLGASDLLVTMAAYNTLTDALRLGCRTVSVPRRGPSTEQVMRADLFAGCDLLTALDPEPTVGQVADAMARALAKPLVVAPPPALDGLTRTTALLRRLLATVQLGGAATPRSSWRANHA